MFNLKRKNPVGRIAAIFALLFVILLPSATFAGQRRGYNDRWRRNYSKQYKHDWKKRAKFRNGHDARDGRWDKRRRGRGVSSDDSLYGRRGRDDDFRRGNRGRGRGRN
ncbi:MAG: hypothetical protein JOZ52_09310 [Acidobacteria bacterium]|nr:hypothetical protein [Acidobacteriota bacterium]